MRTDIIDKKLLFLLEQNARTPDSTLAKKLRRSTETIRYRIKKLERLGILRGFTTWIDPTKVGLQSYKMYLKLANHPQQQDALIDRLKQETRVFWLGRGDGAWDLGVTFFAHSSQEFYTFEHELLSQYDSLILRKQTGVLTKVIVYSKDLFADLPQTTDIMFDKPQHDSLDEVSLTILNHLFKNARASLTYLAQETGTSIDIVRTRITQLKKRKIITRFSASIDYTKLDLEFYKTFVYVKRLSTEDEQRFLETARQHPNIVHVIQQISPWAIELETLVPSYKEYNKIINSLREQFADIIIDVESAIISEDHIFPAGTTMLRATL